MAQRGLIGAFSASKPKSFGATLRRRKRNHDCNFCLILPLLSSSSFPARAAPGAEDFQPVVHRVDDVVQSQSCFPLPHPGAMLPSAPISGSLESWKVLGEARCGLSLRKGSLASHTFSLGSAVGDVNPPPRTYSFLIVSESSRDSDRLQRRKCQVTARATLNMEVEKPSHEARASAVPIMVQPCTLSLFTLEYASSLPL